jgi:tRNA pseudouridine55 synthase
MEKPIGMSSHTVVHKARKALNLKGIGHTGTLDPMASGMLPLVIGEATRFAYLLSGQFKRYRASVQLGSQTTTDDATGTIIEEATVPIFTETTLTSHLEKFLGNITQTVPQYAAIRQNGQRLYHLARRGIKVDAPSRQVITRDLKFLSYDPLQKILCFEITVSSGTYIRAIARDLGLALGCFGHLSALERLWVSPFESLTPLPVSCLGETGKVLGAWIPLKTLLRHEPSVDLSTEQAFSLGHGSVVPIEASFPENTIVCTFYDGHIFGTCHYHEGLLKVKRLRSFPIPWLNQKKATLTENKPLIENDLYNQSQV